MTREQKVRKAQQLRAKGWLQREIAEEMGVGVTTVNTWLADPDLSKQRARRARYTGTCIDCGAKTDGSNGRNNAPKRCQECSTRKQHENRLWTKDTVIEAMQAWADYYGRQPTASDWNTGDGRCDLVRLREGPVVTPAVQIVQREFGSWRAAIEAAGFDQIIRYPGDDPAVVERAAELYRQGVSASEIARRHGCSSTAVRYWLEIAGVPRRSPSEAWQAWHDQKVAA